MASWYDEESERLERIEERIVSSAAKARPENRLAAVYAAAVPTKLTPEMAEALKVLADKRAGAAE